jgi:uncharacterized membrane protein YbhN (UPF0104 family)
MPRIAESASAGRSIASVTASASAATTALREVRLRRDGARDGGSVVNEIVETLNAVRPALVIGTAVIAACAYLLREFLQGGPR